MALLSSTLELLNESSNLTFENNSAREKGGAIYVDPDKFQYALQIQYDHLLDTCLYDTNPWPTNTQQYLNFINNIAQIAGDDIYGARASLEWCNGSVVHMHPKNNSSLSSVSGNPSHVCRCDKQYYKPAIIFQAITILVPTILVRQFQSQLHVVVGGDSGATPGMVYARFQPPYTSPSSQYNQWINKSRCTSLNYTVYSNDKTGNCSHQSKHSFLTINRNDLITLSSYTLSRK